MLRPLSSLLRAMAFDERSLHHYYGDSPSTIQVRFRGERVLEVSPIPEPGNVMRFTEVVFPQSLNLTDREREAFTVNFRRACDEMPPCNVDVWRAESGGLYILNHEVDRANDAEMSLFFDACARDILNAMYVVGRSQLMAAWSGGGQPFSEVMLDGPHAFDLPYFDEAVEMERIMHTVVEGPHGDIVPLRMSPKSPRPAERCPICHKKLKSGVASLPCGHALHARCMRQYVEHTGATACPMCRARTYGGRKHTTARRKSLRK